MGHYSLSSDTQRLQPFLWTQATGTVSLRDLIAQLAPGTDHFELQAVDSSASGEWVLLAG